MLSCNKANLKRNVINQKEKTEFKDRSKQKINLKEEKIFDKNKRFDELLNLIKETNSRKDIFKETISNQEEKNNFIIKEKKSILKEISGMRLKFEDFYKYNIKDKRLNENSYLLNVCKGMKGCFIQPANALSEKNTNIKY